MAKTRRKIKKKAPASKLARSEKELKHEREERVGLPVKVKKASKKKTSRTRKKAAAHTPRRASKAEARAERVIQAYKDKVDKQKRLIMWSGVSFFMILIAFFWLYNTKQVIRETQLKNQSNNNDLNLEYWSELSDELGDRINELRGDLDELKTEEAGSATSSGEQLNQGKFPSSDDEESTTTKENDKAGEIEELKQKLKELEDKIDS